MNKKENALKTFMDNVPMGRYKDIKDEIIAACYISESTWKNWLSGRTAIPELAKLEINRITGEKVFEIEKVPANHGSE
ncbi:MAG: hypothetical protein LBQ74_14680 [Prevotella sp.]|jgi:hypothetical protein|nr:hypothetical protein [Prevotella sp.]